jgi:hypothetical protein
VLQQRPPDAVALRFRRDIRVADQLDVAHPLDAHDAGQHAVALVTPEHHAGGDLRVELVRRHVRLAPAIRRDHVPVGLGRRVDDAEDRRALVVMADADHGAGRR